MFLYARRTCTDYNSSTSALYPLQDLKAALNTYIVTHDLLNKAEQQFVNADTDSTLRDALWPQTGKSPHPVPEFVKREKLLSTLCSRMQPWYRIQLGSSEPATKQVAHALQALQADVSCRKGQLKPISIVVKLRQGRKACTLITGHESFLLSSNAIADVLRSRCASATSGKYLTYGDYAPFLDKDNSRSKPRARRGRRGYGSGEANEGRRRLSRGDGYSKEVDVYGRHNGKDKEVNAYVRESVIFAESLLARHSVEGV
jgi:translation initiation factor 1 (eIF-1/SUI1)